MRIVWHRGVQQSRFEENFFLGPTYLFARSRSRLSVAHKKRFSWSTTPLKIEAEERNKKIRGGNMITA